MDGLREDCLASELSLGRSPTLCDLPVPLSGSLRFPFSPHRGPEIRGCTQTLPG